MQLLQRYCLKQGKSYLFKNATIINHDLEEKKDLLIG